MNISSNAIPEHIKRLMPSAVRASMGAAARTTEEAVTIADDKAELDLQSDIANYLRLHEIEYIKPDGRKKSPLPPGWSDFTFSYRPVGATCYGMPVAMEVKTPIGKLSPDQVTRHELLRRNGWRVVIVRSVADVQALLRAIDAEMSPPAAALAELRKEAL